MCSPSLRTHQRTNKTKQNKQNNKRNQKNTQTKTKKMSQTPQIQSPSNLLESLKLLDGNGAIDKKRVMDRKGVKVQNKHLYHYIKWVKPLDMAAPLGGFTAESIQFQVCCCCKTVFAYVKGGSPKSLQKHYDSCKKKFPESYEDLELFPQGKQQCQTSKPSRCVR